VDVTVCEASAPALIVSAMGAVPKGDDVRVISDLSLGEPAPNSYCSYAQLLPYECASVALLRCRGVSVSQSSLALASATPSTARISVEAFQSQCISVFNRGDGALVRRFGSGGSGDGQLSRPLGLCFMSDGLLGRIARG
jgi:hypothetical protein